MYMTSMMSNTQECIKTNEYENQVFDKIISIDLNERMVDQCFVFVC